MLQSRMREIGLQNRTPWILFINADGPPFGFMLSTRSEGHLLYPVVNLSTFPKSLPFICHYGLVNIVKGSALLYAFTNLSSLSNGLPPICYCEPFDIVERCFVCSPTGSKGLICFEKCH